MAAGKPQPSRKGKKAWRKNVDVDDIQKALEEKTEREIHFGTGDQDFIIDDEGDDSLSKKHAVSRLKSTEILTNKSKVKPLRVEKDRVQGVSKKQIRHLMTISGKVTGKSALKARTQSDGIVRSKDTKRDLWDTEEEVEQIPEVLTKNPVHPRVKPKHAPKSMLIAPIKLYEENKSDDGVPVHAGKSYNPTLESWNGLIDQEFQIEKQLELKRLEAKEYQDKINWLIANTEDNEIQETDSEDEDEANVEEEVDDENKYKISLNAPTKVKIKTRTQRNKEAKQKQRKELEAKVRELKQQVKELEKLDTYQKEVLTKLAEPQPVKERKVKKLSKHDTKDRPLEIKLSDELSGNLRNLKPEGNLFYDEMIKLQSSGKVEARNEVERRRRYKQQIKEKWSFRDFK